MKGKYGILLLIMNTRARLLRIILLFNSKVICSFLGLMHEMHKDPKSGAILCVCQCVSVSVCQCVSVSVCHFEDETTRDRSLRYNKLVDWVLVIASHCFQVP